MKKFLIGKHVYLKSVLHIKDYNCEFSIGDYMILSDSMKAIIKLEQINQNGNDFIINKSKDKVFRVQSGMY